MIARVKLWLAAAGAFVLAVAVAVIFGRREGAQNERAKRDAKTIKRTERGRSAVQDGRDSGLSPDERLRRNDGNW